MNDQPGSGVWRRPERRWLLGIPVGGFLALVLGAALLGSFNWILHQSSSNEFCYVCHSHEAFIKPEYEASSHFKNTSGVRASCADCHVPHDWLGTVLLKARATLDIIPEVAGKLSTAEKYESHRRDMAIAVWRDYLRRDSDYCESCHTTDAMVLENQERRTQRKHEQAEEKGESCIECHQGVVHKLPENWKEAWNEVLAES